MTQLESDQIHATITKLLAAAAKLQAEQGKLQLGSRYYPFVAGAAVFAAATGFAFAALKLLMERLS